MSATYYLILTAYGAARIAQLQADQSSAPLLVNQGHTLGSGLT